MSRITRRSALLGAAAALTPGLALRPLSVQARAQARADAPADAAAAFRLVAGAAEAPLVVPQGPPTAAWLYNGQAPGPVMRARQGETLTVEVENRLPEPTTVHWHGLRVPNAMDGVPHFSQSPIAPGETFAYTLPLNDAGTFWYHPHVNSSEQLGRGLRGVLVVDEAADGAAALGADRDVVWALEDWRLDRDAQIAPFGGMHDAAHGGRLGNVVTLNGSIRSRETAAPGERLRLRLLNMANAASFSLRFDGADAWLVAEDGHPVAPRALADDRLWLGAGQRADVVLDMPAAPGAEVAVIDDAFGPDNAFRITTLAASDAAPLRSAPLPPPETLPANPVARPDLADADRHDLVFEGGMMGGMRGGMMGGRMMGMREMMQAGRVWALNGVAAAAQMADMTPLFTFSEGRSQVVTLRNDTAWPHPIHLHGHSFHVLGPDGGDGSGDPLAGAPLRDTVLLAPREQTVIAFVADNPGDWMLHCHILEHQETGMMAVARVA